MQLDNLYCLWNYIHLLIFSLNIFSSYLSHLLLWFMSQCECGPVLILEFAWSWVDKQEQWSQLPTHWPALLAKLQWLLLEQTQLSFVCFKPAFASPIWMRELPEHSRWIARESTRFSIVLFILLACVQKVFTYLAHNKFLLFLELVDGHELCSAMEFLYSIFSAWLKWFYLIISVSRLETLKL